MTDSTPARDGGGLTRDDIVADLRELGLGSAERRSADDRAVEPRDDADEVVVHASLSSLGWVEGGAGTVVDALSVAVGEEGTVVVPTFTPSVVREEPFDPDETRSRTGAITEALRTRPDARRSGHPTHSVTALGPAAGKLTDDHPLESSLGPDSPLHRLARRGGKILLLGVGHERNSTIHVGEALADLPYKRGTNEVLVRDASGAVRTVETSKVGCGKGFPAVEPIVDDAGVLARGRVGEADAQLMRGEAIISVALEVLEDDPGFLLCDRPDCWWCPGARRALEAAGG